MTKSSHTDVARYAKKVSVLQANLFLCLTKNKHMDSSAMGELMEDAGNRILDLADEIRTGILECRSKAGAPRSSREGGRGH